jgi:hypothetical protein
MGYEKAVAEHNGYRKIKVVHRRSISCITSLHWLVEDTIYSLREDKKPHSIQLHWLTHDWPYDVYEYKIRMEVPLGYMQLGLSAVNQEGQPLKAPATLSIIRAGETVYGPAYSDENFGWISPTYSEKRPALAMIFNVKALLPIRILSVWNFIYNRTR